MNRYTISSNICTDALKVFDMRQNFDKDGELRDGKRIEGFNWAAGYLVKAVFSVQDVDGVYLLIESPWEEHLEEVLHVTRVIDGTLHVINGSSLLDMGPLVQAARKADFKLTITAPEDLDKVIDVFDKFNQETLHKISCLLVVADVDNRFVIFDYKIGGKNITTDVTTEAAVKIQYLESDLEAAKKNVESLKKDLTEAKAPKSVTLNASGQWGFCLERIRENVVEAMPNNWVLASYGMTSPRYMLVSATGEVFALLGNYLCSTVKENGVCKVKEHLFKSNLLDVNDLHVIMQVVNRVFLKKGQPENVVVDGWEVGNPDDKRWFKERVKMRASNNKSYDRRINLLHGKVTERSVEVPSVEEELDKIVSELRKDEEHAKSLVGLMKMPIEKATEKMKEKFGMK